jgi:hypothetical protein
MRSSEEFLLAGAVLAVIDLLFPPWSFSGGSWGGYHFILSPPTPSAHINSSLLFLELVALGLIAWFLFVAARNVTARRLSKVALLIITSSVVLVVVLFAWVVWPKSYTEGAGVRTTRLTGTRYVWSEKSGWITEAEKKAEDAADDIQLRNTAKPVLDELIRVVVERDDGTADHLFIHNPTHWPSKRLQQTNSGVLPSEGQWANASENCPESTRNCPRNKRYLPI